MGFMRQKWKRYGLVLLFVFILFEVGLRLFGMRGGYIDPWFHVVDSVVHRDRFYSDEMGIIHFKESAYTPSDYVLNSEGFRSRHEFNRTYLDSVVDTTAEKVVMFIGDSYVEGCCADPIGKSFVDLLDARDDILVLNFGMAGTDPLQYRLVAEKYVAELKPDLVVVGLFLGNDEMEYDRIARPRVPMFYPVQGSGWLPSEPTPILRESRDQYFKSAQEAHDFFANEYSMFGPDRLLTTRLFGHSALFTALYLGPKFLYLRSANEENWKEPLPNGIATRHLAEIRQICKLADVQVEFIGLPSPVDVIHKVDLRARYGYMIEEIRFPDLDKLSAEGFDGEEQWDHMNNKGHEKIANWLRRELNDWKR